jgi:hypothetical protein
MGSADRCWFERNTRLAFADARSLHFDVLRVVQKSHQ